MTGNITSLCVCFVEGGGGEFSVMLFLYEIFPPTTLLHGLVTLGQSQMALVFGIDSQERYDVIKAIPIFTAKVGFCTEFPNFVAEVM